MCPSALALLRALRLTLRARLAAGVRKNTVDLSSAVQKAARLEAGIVAEGDQAAGEKQEQVAALLAAAEAIIADQELREFMTERNRAALDASLALFGNKGVIKVSRRDHRHRNGPACRCSISGG